MVFREEGFGSTLRFFLEDWTDPFSKKEPILVACLKLWRTCMEQNYAIPTIAAALPSLSSALYLSIDTREVRRTRTPHEAGPGPHQTYFDLLSSRAARLARKMSGSSRSSF